MAGFIASPVRTDQGRLVVGLTVQFLANGYKLEGPVQNSLIKDVCRSAMAWDVLTQTAWGDKLNELVLIAAELRSLGCWLLQKSIDGGGGCSRNFPDLLYSARLKNHLSLAHLLFV
jgi:hypothetical protein